MDLIYPVKTDGPLATWASSFARQISANPETFYVSLTTAAAVQAAADQYAASYLAAVDPDTRSRRTIQTKDTHREALRETVAPVVAQIQAQPAVTDTQRQSLGLRVRKPTNTPAALPTSAPTVTAFLTGPNTVRVQVRDPLSPDSRAKPAGAKEVAVLAYLGATPPSDVMQWPTSTISGRTDIDLYWPGMVGETTVWISCYWVGSRRQVGKYSVPVSVRLPGIGGQSATLEQTPAEPTMKIAA